MDTRRRLSGRDALLDYFARADWEVGPVPDGPAVNWAFRGSNGEWYGQSWWIEETEQLLHYSICPLPIPAVRRAEVAEFVLLVNAELVTGCFEIDLADGQLRFRTGVPVARTDLSPDLIDRSITANVATMDRYLPGIVLTVAGRSAAEALGHIEAG
jgi:hypothetical protein